MNEKKRAARWGRVAFAVAFVLMVLASGTIHVRAQGQLVVAGMLDGTLYAWREGDAQPHALVSDGVLRLALSPDGVNVAYTRNDGDAHQFTLWATELIVEPSPRLLVDARTLTPADPTRQIGQFVWSVDGATLYFNTTTGAGLVTTPQNDLWRVNVHTANVEPLLAVNEGGLIVPAPDGEWLALVSAGHYGVTPAQIAFYHTQNGQRITALSFDAVSSGSEHPWYPVLRWLPDGKSVRVAVPPPNWLYGEGEGVALWELRPDRDAQQLGTVEADFFGLPRFSPNGERILYIQRRTSPQQSDWTLTVAAANGLDVAEYVRGSVVFGSLRWLPRGERFLYALDDEPRALWMGEIGRPPVRFPAPDVRVSALTWADEETFVYLVQNEDRSYTLYYATLSAPDRATPVFTMEDRPLFDALRP